MLFRSRSENEALWCNATLMTFSHPQISFVANPKIILMLFAITQQESYLIYQAERYRIILTKNGGRTQKSIEMFADEM